MAEEPYVTRDQQRADMAELRSELREEIAGLRQDMAVLAKTVEMGFAELRQAMTQLREETRQEMARVQTCVMGVTKCVTRARTFVTCGPQVSGRYGY